MSRISRRELLLLAAAWALSACGQSRPAAASLPGGSRVLALGDSLTFGYGAAPQAAYPAQLAELTGWQVVNGGVSGDTAAQALARLPALLVPVPKLMLLSIGGNDFLRRLPESETRTHIGRCIETAREAGVPTVLIAQPHFTPGALFGRLSDHPLYAELAEQYQVPLLAGAWSEILGEDKWKSDQIHANAAGYRHFAELLAGFLREQGFR